METDVILVIWLILCKIFVKVVVLYLNVQNWAKARRLDDRTSIFEKYFVHQYSEILSPVFNSLAEV